MANILSIPEEVRSEIAGHLEPDDLKNLMKTCRALRAAAMRELLAEVRVYPSQKSCDRFNGTRKDPELNKLVRHIEFSTVGPQGERAEHRNHPRWPNNWGTQEKRDAMQKLKEEFGQVLNALSDFTGLTTVSLRLSYLWVPAIAQPAWTLYGRQSDQGYNETFYHTIFRDLFLALDHAGCKVKTISIDNLHNVGDAQFMASPPVRNVLARVKRLRLCIDNDAAGHQWHWMGDLAHTYMAQLRPLWLEPSAETLTTLVLGQPYWFGYYPKLDLRGLHFPNLRTLALKKYTFIHDWQLEWLTSCSPVLTNIYLDHCIAVFYTALREYAEDDDGFPIFSQPRPNNISPSFKFHNMTWSRIFDHLRDNLPTLRHFRIGCSSFSPDQGRPPFAISDYQNLKMGLYWDRYRIFRDYSGDRVCATWLYGSCNHARCSDCGNSGSVHSAVFWSKANPHTYLKALDGNDTPQGRKAYVFLFRLEQQMEKDEEALDALLAATGQESVVRAVPQGLGPGKYFWISQGIRPH